MKKQKKFCLYCGNPIVQKKQDDKLRDYCPHCNEYFYENPLPVVSTIVINEKREVLLVLRKNDPYKGMWCLPIGFAESGEDMGGAALRELEEETGIKGEIVRLIDVDTVENYFYGSLAIVTYEARIIAGELMPGDDAADSKYFPLKELPELAWPSNEKAIEIYISLYSETWAMIDSYRQLYPEIDSIDMISQPVDGQRQLLSNVMVKMLNRDHKDISRQWAEELEFKIPVLKKFMDELIQINSKILWVVQNHLKGNTDVSNYLDFMEIGKKLSVGLLPLPELITAMALSRKSIWKHVINKKIFASPLEMYITLELNNRIIFIYDRVNYFITKGYCG